MTRRLATMNASARCVLGIALLAAPRLARGWLGSDVHNPAGLALTRMLGARDLALGGGALVALRAGRDVRPWMVGAAGADLVDAVAARSTGGGRRTDLATLAALAGAASAAAGALGAQ